MSTLVIVSFPRAPRFEIHSWSMLEPWRGRIFSKGLWCREGNCIPWVVHTSGEESWTVGIVVGGASLCFIGY
jgi:hypothetical protein